jgi:hypothetical protein
VRATCSGIGYDVGRWYGKDRSFPIDSRGALEVRLRRSPRMPGRAVVLWYSWDDGGLLLYLLLLLQHRKPECAPWLLFSPFAIGHLKLAYGWWREPIPFLGDSLWVCKIGFGVPRRKGCVASLKDACGEDRGWRLEALVTTAQDFYLSFSPRSLY